MERFDCERIIVLLLLMMMFCERVADPISAISSKNKTARVREGNGSANLRIFFLKTNRISKINHFVVVL